MNRSNYLTYILLLTFGIGYSIALHFYFLKPANENTSDKIQALPAQKFDKSVTKQEIAEVENEIKLDNPICIDKVRSALWNELKKDKIYRDWIGWKKIFTVDGRNCKELLRIEYYDLNGDGNKEILVRGDWSFCGATANCAFWVFKKRNGRYQKILSANSYLDGRDVFSQIKKSRTNKYKDIMLEVRVSRNAHAYRLYKFNGKKYKDRKCEIHKWDENSWNEESSSYKTQITSCKQFERKNYKLNF